ncbi:MAG TPA: 2'-5' RNA ligase family protein [Chloroflexi bacterium]|nr:2'-5' RNA ligase family protein [Chloroflexota bacterium]
MYAIVSLLDPVHTAEVTALWQELEATFGLRGIYATPYPHFSYHVAEQYNDALITELEEIARTTAPFTVETSGLGLFTGPFPILFIQVVRSAPLNALHQALWPHLTRHAQKPVAYYRPASWVPHITLAHSDLTVGNLPEIIAHLCARRFNWQLPIDNLTLVCEHCGSHDLHSRLALSGIPEVE